MSDQTTQPEEIPAGDGGNLEALSAAWDSAEAEQGEVQGSVEEAAPEPVAHGEERAAAEPEGVEPPEHWAPADKEIFKQADPVHQRWLMQRYKDMERGVNEKFQSLAEQRKQVERDIALADTARQHFAPITRMLATQGVDEAGAMRIASAWLQSYYSNPRATVQQLAQQAGISLNAASQALKQEAGQQQDQEIYDPQVRRIKQQLDALTQHTVQQQHAQQAAAYRLWQAQQQHVRENVKGEWASFREYKDESGRLVFPHADELKTEMAGLLTAQANGQYLVKDLQDAYQKALAMRPDLRAKEQAMATAADRVRKAKLAASAQVTGSGAAQGGFASWEDALGAAFNHVQT